MMMGLGLLVVIAVVAAVIWGARQGWTPDGGGQKSQTALDILEGRFARGEIDRQEYQERRTILETQ